MIPPNHVGQFSILSLSEVVPGWEKDKNTYCVRCQVCGAQSEKWPSETLYDLQSGIAVSEIPWVKAWKDKHLTDGCQ